MKSNLEPSALGYRNKIGILGCGWLGLPLASHLLNLGLDVFGSSTSKEKLPQLSELGIQPYLVDIETSKIPDDFLKVETLIIAIPSKNVNAFEYLIQQIKKSPIENVVFISSTSVYPNTNGVVTEETSTIDAPLVMIEHLFQKQEFFRTTILRFGGLFGYNRKPGNFIRPGKPMPNPEGYINFIHRDDCIGIIEAIINQNAWNEVFNACSEDHPKRRDFYLKQAQKVGTDSVLFDENGKTEFKIVSSQKVIDKLGYQFKFNDLMK